MVVSMIAALPQPTPPILTTNFNKGMTNEESYADRRQLFKNIWEAAMNIDGKEDIMAKPKVIKTLRLDEMDKCVVWKTKKQRIKNLRHVCKRILDFCDKQDANDTLYEKVAIDAQKTTQDEQTIEIKAPKKVKTRIIMKKKVIKKAKSMFGSPSGPIQVVMAAVSERKDELPRKAKNKTPSSAVPNKIKRTSFMKNSDNNSKKSPTNLGPAGTSSIITKESQVPVTHRIVRKRHCKKKKHLKSNITTGYVMMPSNYEKPRHTGHAAVDQTETLRKQLKMNKIMTN